MSIIDSTNPEIQAFYWTDRACSLSPLALVMVQVPPLRYVCTPSCTTLRRKRRVSAAASSSLPSTSSSPRAPIVFEYSLGSLKPSWKTLSFRSSPPTSPKKSTTNAPKFLNLKTASVESRRVESVVSGELSEWSYEVPNELVVNLFGIRYSEEEERYIRVEDELARTSQEAVNYLIQKYLSAQRSSRRVSIERSKLGMSGGRRDRNSLNDLERLHDGAIDALLRGRRKSCDDTSPISAYRDQMEEENLCYVKTPFIYLGQDPVDDNIFYFEQDNSLDPSREQRVRWRLKGIRDKEWISAAPRPYGPSRSWGGAWGGNRSLFSNSKDLNQPGVLEYVGGEVRLKDVFLLNVVHNIKAAELPTIEFSRNLACSRSVLSESSTISFGNHPITSHKRTMIRPVSKQSSKSTYAAIQDVQVGLPLTGYPGWRNRHSTSPMKLTPMTSTSQDF